MANTRKASAVALEAELSDSLYITVEILGETFHLRKKFKRLRFLRQLNSDPMSALELVFAEGEIERLEDLDMTDEELSGIFETISDALVGGPKN